MLDDFGVKYIGEDHAKHLVSVVGEHYESTMDWEGSKYCGLTMEWDHKKEKYIYPCQDMLKRHQSDLTTRGQVNPKTNHMYMPPNYGSKVKCAKPEDISPLPSKADKNGSYR